MKFIGCIWMYYCNINKTNTIFKRLQKKDKVINSTVFFLTFDSTFDWVNRFFIWKMVLLVWSQFSQCHSWEKHISLQFALSTCAKSWPITQYHANRYRCFYFYFECWYFPYGLIWILFISWSRVLLLNFVLY